MGRHRKQTPATISRSSILALTGLVPASVVAVNATAAVNTDPTAATVQMHLPSADSDKPDASMAAAERPVVDENAVHAMAKQSRSVEPEIKTVARPAGRPRAELPPGHMGIPGIANAAYTSAEQILAEENPECGMSWTMLAGIGRVESTHMFDGRADAEGNALEPVYGPALDGSLSGNNVISDSDGGALDGIAGYDRAVGPMQFLPETWARYGADGNGDGIADPQNYYDATLTAGKYLCDGGLNMRDVSQQTRAILRYNHSMAYVANVMAWANSYNTGVTPHPSELPRIH
ncbi:lytic transglycosylase domain-containing protein [Nocardia brevicatena]|uniref:lytic transglycosylase domain-containing protein n=1 Tax=Nocardia brevicatena TaxID=37327 RepID=UPI0002E58AB0|nr:lytic murein transglycosylase [Nocardia brevicatena]